MVMTGIRKVAMPATEIQRVKEYAWRNHLSVSQWTRDILAAYIEEPKAFADLPDMEGALSLSLTVYIPDELWFSARDMAYVHGRKALAPVIRKGFRAALESEQNPDAA